MPQPGHEISTGLSGLDRVLTGLIPGDNIVWQVASVGDYEPFVGPYCRYAAERGKKLVYLRFSKYPPLLPASIDAEVCELNPEAGFEAFVSSIHKVIERTGREGYYVFDVLSDLAVDWYSDQMLANFFVLTCPYVLEMGAIAFFGLLQGCHSQEAVGAITDTTQILIDVFRHEGAIYIHPNKVEHRYSPTMHMLHVRDGDEFRPVMQSATVSEIMTGGPWPGLERSGGRRGVVDRNFAQAAEVIGAARERGEPPPESAELLRGLLRACLSRDPRVLALLEKYVMIEDVLAVRKRMIGTGLIGGKSVGMLLARAILRTCEARWAELLEPHDSFYVGSDVYYGFIVRNGLWRAREQQKDRASSLEGLESARRKIMEGVFPDYVMGQFGAMLDYYGQSPIIVRSSSLLEDSFGNSFAGKYESVFCANQGPRDKRMEDLLAAVRTIYASTMSEAALTYRAQRGLLERDEQMALLVQRVSGGMHGGLFYPEVAGVGLSYNPYVWSGYIDPGAGMMRMVFGLGTRAVDRSDDDYTRVVALNAPERRPDSNIDDLRRYSQRRVDVIDLSENRFAARDFAAVVEQSDDLPLDMFASQDAEMKRRAAEAGGRAGFPWVLTFERLLTATGFVQDMRRMLAVLQAAYEYPVDTEFTVNFSPGGGYRINLVQCRPLQVQGGGVSVEPPEVAPEDLLLEACGTVIGRSRMETVDRVVYVRPSAYSRLPIRDRYSVAKLIGRVVHRTEGVARIMLVGPGRWGTSTPSLGVPVNFAEISAVSVLCELVTMREGLVPDVSLGTHFFNEIVETDMLYLALYPGKKGNRLNEALLEAAPNRLGELLGGEQNLQDVIHVADVSDLPGGPVLRLNADVLKQRIVCYLEGPGDPSRE